MSTRTSKTVLSASFVVLMVLASSRVIAQDATTIRSFASPPHVGETAIKGFGTFSTKRRGGGLLDTYYCAWKDSAGKIRTQRVDALTICINSVKIRCTSDGCTEA